MTKDEIYTACLAVMAETDLTNTSLSDIAARLNIKKSSLYFYFKDKKELISKSLEYAEANIKISNFQVNFSHSVDEIFSNLLFHYTSLFSLPLSRYWLSCILRLDEYTPHTQITLDDILYTFETQISVILQELAKRDKITLSFPIETLSHLISLLIFELIILSSTTQKTAWKVERTLEEILTFLK